MPLFDERFINYGFNKQQWVEHLRYKGYKFAQLVQGYGIDIPHPSYFLLNYLSMLRTKFKKQWGCKGDCPVKRMPGLFRVFYN